MTKDEAKAAVMRLMRAECTCGIPGVKEPCFACEMSAGLDVLAQAAANADTLGMLEALAKRYGYARTKIGERDFIVAKATDSLHYHYVLGRQASGISRAEAEALLVRGEKKE